MPPFSRRSTVKPVSLALLSVHVSLTWVEESTLAASPLGAAGGAVEPAWAELRATAIDLGVPWPDFRSPQETRDLLVRFLGAPGSGDGLERPARGEEVAPEAVEALDRLVLTLELLRYARPQSDTSDAIGDGPIDPQVVEDTRTVQAALYAGATRRAQRRATWWPASVLPWRSRAGELPAASASERTGVVDHVG